MAEFTADLSPKSNSMSLGDMMKMGLYSAETAIANRKAQIADEQAKEMPIVMTFMKNQDKYMTNGRIDLDKASVLPIIAPLTGADQYEKLVKLHKYRTEADEAEVGLDTKQRQIVASTGETLGYAGVQDPKQYIQAYQGLKQLYPNNSHIAQLADAYSNMIGTMPPGPHIAQAAIKNSVDLLNPQTKHEMFAPKAQVSTIGGASRPVVNQPSIMGSQPSVTPTEFGGGQNAVGGGGTTEAPKPSAKDRDLIKYDQYLDYKGNPALANYTTEQKEALDNGKNLLKESNALASAAKEQEANTRGVIENISAASGNRPGQLLRQGGKYIIGNATQEMLNKNIARMAAASEVMGTAKTDQSRADAKVINGSDDLTAQALTDIVSRADATVKAATMFNSAYNKLIEKRGVNGYIQAEKLKSAWVDNYDVRMAQIDALAASNSPEAKAKANEIYASIPKDQREDFNRKWSNLHALEQGKFR